MSDKAKHKRQGRIRRHNRVRRRIEGTPDRPRMAVFRSNKHIAVQVIDDLSGRTLAAATSTEPGITSGGTSNIGAATDVGKAAAERAQAAGITTVVFDRGGFRYHGRVAAVADAAREAGLKL